MINTGNTAYVLGCAALVMLMTPGLAFFYGGLVRARSVLSIMMMSFTSLAVVGLVWVVYGFSLAFGNDVFGGLIGGLEHVGLRDAAATAGAAPDAIPLQAFAMFQLMFAVITAALIAGAVAERTRFWPWVIFMVLWTTLVYVPLAHWAFAFNGFAAEQGGWMANTLKSLDFAGGTVVEINSGFSALALCLVLGARRGWPREPMRPHNLPAVLLGAGLLWFGWFGFNAGSALAANATAANAFVTTMTASAAAVISWLALEHRLDGRPTSLGAASAAIAGLVGITPACGYVDTIGALVIGLGAGVRVPAGDQAQVPARLRRLAGRAGAARCCGALRHDHDRAVRVQGGEPGRRGRAVLRRRVRPAVAAVGGRAGRAGVRVRGHLPDQLADQGHNRVPGDRRGRGRRDRRGGARRDGLRVLRGRRDGPRRHHVGASTASSREESNR